MLLHKDEFPITIQAFDITDNKEFFIAEQIVNNQQEVDTFSNRYAGKVIKVKAISSATAGTTNAKRKGKSTGATVFLVILIIMIILIAIGFYTGWIQSTTGIHL